MRRRGESDEGVVVQPRDGLGEGLPVIHVVFVREDHEVREIA